MFAPHIIASLLLALPCPASGMPQPEWKTVRVEGIRVACVGRFDESLQQHIVKAHPWIHSVRLHIIHPVANQPKRQTVAGSEFLIGNAATLEFEIDLDRSDEELATLLMESGRYAGVENWVLVRRVPFAELVRRPGD